MTRTKAAGRPAGGRTSARTDGSEPRSSLAASRPGLAQPRAGLAQRKRDLVRAEIARAAWELFDREGYEKTTVDAIAREAGLSRRTFFRYYSSKDDVAVGTSDSLAEDFLAAFTARPASEPPLVSIHRALRPLVEGRARDPEQWRAIIRLLRGSRSLRRAMLERHARVEERLAAVIAERSGTDLRNDPTPALLAFVARALLDTAFNVWFDQNPRDPGAMVDDLFRRLREAVVPTGGVRPPAVRSRGARRASAGR